MHSDVQYWIDHLNLEEHPEGGYFRETYRSEDQTSADCLPERFDGARNFSTAIYFLLTSEDFSAFHRLQADEVWHFYAGSPVTIYIIQPNGQLKTKRVGHAPDEGIMPQVNVKSQQWFAAAIEEPDSYGLFGCNTAPGFEFDDFELGTQEELLSQYPQHEDLILKYTRTP